MIKICFDDIGASPRWALPVRTASSLIGVAATLFLAGCGYEDVRVYEAPKDKPAQAANPHGAGMAGMGGGMMGADMGGLPPVPKVKWKLPAGWQELPPGQMRVGLFSVAQDAQKAQITIIPLPGLAGGDLENLNRWRGQVGLGPVDAETMAKSVEKVDVGGLEGMLFDLPGGTPEAKVRMLAVIVHRDNTAWFFKMTGDDALVAAQKPVLTQFLKDFSFGEPGAVAEAQPAAAVSEPAPASHAPAGGTPAWAPPKSWSPVAPGSMQVAKFVIQNGGGRAEVAVSSLPGDAGGVTANVNRWRRQLGLPELAEADLKESVQRLPDGVGEGYMVDLQAGSTKRRMVAAAVSQGATTWFYKLTGDEGTVGGEKDGFVEFIKGVKYGPTR